MLGDVVEQRGEHWQKSSGGVAYVLRYTFHLLQRQREGEKMLNLATLTKNKETSLRTGLLLYIYLTWFLVDTFPSLRFSTIFSISSAALSKKERKPAFTISGPDFITVLEEKVKEKTERHKMKIKDVNIIKTHVRKHVVNTHTWRPVSGKEYEDN